MARSDVFDYIEMFYNRIRRNSHLDVMSPQAFETGSFKMMLSRVENTVSNPI